MFPQPFTTAFAGDDWSVDVRLVTDDRCSSYHTKATLVLDGAEYGWSQPSETGTYSCCLVAFFVHTTTSIGFWDERCIMEAGTVELVGDIAKKDKACVIMAVGQLVKGRKGRITSTSGFHTVHIVVAQSGTKTLPVTFRGPWLTVIAAEVF